MPKRWTLRLAKAGLFLGGCYLAVTYFDPARGSVDANERVKEIVEATTQRPAEKPFELIPDEIMSIKPAPVADRLRISGDIQSLNRVVMRAKSAGRIATIPVREGEVVKAGDVIARFEADDLRSVLLREESERAAADAELRLARQVLDRLDQLAAKNVVSKEQVDKARGDVATKTSSVHSLSAQVAIARLALREAEVVAPFNGTIASRAVELGSQVSADAELLTLVDTTALEAKVLISTRDISRIVVGQPAELQVDGLEGQSVPAIVARINPLTDNGTRFVAVYLSLPNQDGRLRGGMFATGSILLREKADAIVVPAVSMRSDGMGDYVLKLQDGQLLRQAVTISSTWSGGKIVEIGTGLEAGETIITAPLSELRPGVAVSLTASKAG